MGGVFRGFVGCFLAVRLCGYLFRGEHISFSFFVVELSKTGDCRPARAQRDARSFLQADPTVHATTSAAPAMLVGSGAARVSSSCHANAQTMSMLRIIAASPAGAICMPLFRSSCGNGRGRRRGREKTQAATIREIGGGAVARRHER